MKQAFPRLATAAPLLLASSLAAAHGSEAGANTLVHYLSSPDHVATFCVLVLASVGTVAWWLRRSLREVKQRKR